MATAAGIVLAVLIAAAVMAAAGGMSAGATAGDESGPSTSTQKAAHKLAHMDMYKGFCTTEEKRTTDAFCVRADLHNQLMAMDVTAQEEAGLEENETVSERQKKIDELHVAVRNSVSTDAQRKNFVQSAHAAKLLYCVSHTDSILCAT